MSDAFFRRLTAARIDWRDGVPCAPDFDDPYFSLEDGISESRHVFLDGNRLTERFSELPPGGRFVIAETGFGTGLNFLLACALFLRLAPADARLHFVSTEAHPLSPVDLADALARHPALAREASELSRQYPPASPGFHRRWLFADRVSLTLLFGDARNMLSLAQFKADAWFLDGFAPARNPDMWTPALYAEMHRLSAPGATLATFTAAGHVRRGLTESGFLMQRQAGFGRKRHMLTGTLPGQWQPARLGRGAALVAGAGLAGSTVAYALASRGWQVTVLDPAGIAQAASGNLAGVVYTSASAHPTAQNRFYQSSFLLARHWLDRLGFPNSRDQGVLAGVTQYAVDARHQSKAIAALQAGLWDRTSLQGDPDSGELHFEDGGCISPSDWCRTLLGHDNISVLEAQVSAVETAPDQVRVRTAAGTTVTADHLVLANSAAAMSLLPDLAVTLKQIRGQVTHVAATEASADWKTTLCHSGYLSPALAGIHCVGATFDLHDASPTPRPEDDQRNLQELATHLPHHWRALGGENARITGNRVGFRCQSPDFLPLAGRVPGLEGRVWLSAAHGSRGIAGTPLCAEVIAARMDHEPAPADSGILEAIDPGRFIKRRQQKGRK